MLVLADQLRGAGHDVVSPDLFDGRRFATINDGVEHLETYGLAALLERSQDMATEFPAGTVFAGVSMGVICAQYLAQTHPGAAGAVLIDACLPAAEFGVEWPASVPAQIHGMSSDPLFVDFS